MSKAKDIINMMEMASLQPGDTGTLLPIWITRLWDTKTGALRYEWNGAKLIPK